jgi:hypothetical protein
LKEALGSGLGLSTDQDRGAKLSGLCSFFNGPARTIGQSDKLLRWLAVGLIALGVIGRLVRYFLQFPIWGDEAFICFNLLDRDFAGLTDLGRRSVHLFQPARPRLRRHDARP